MAVDRSDYACDTLSTHALMRGGVLQLLRWGVLRDVVAAGTPPVREAVFHYGNDEVTVPIGPKYGVDALYAPRRILLDRLLVDAARASGAEIRYRLRAVDLLYSLRRRVTGIVVVDPDGRSERIMADVVIGADGLRSTVARLVDVEPYRVGRHASAILYAYWHGLDVRGYNWYYNRNVTAGAIPTNNGWTCVFVALPAASFRAAVSGGVEAGYRRLLAHAAPRLIGSLRGDPIGFHAFSGQTGFMRQSWGPGWALVGDAGCFRDPTTAHGITDALRDADLLAQAVVDGSEQAFAEYQAERDAVSGSIFETTDEIASFAWDLSSIRQLNDTLARDMATEAKAIAARAGLRHAVATRA
jgi:flavin-dependent dehydrogenase